MSAPEPAAENQYTRKVLSSWNWFSIWLAAILGWFALLHFAHKESILMGEHLKEEIARDEVLIKNAAILYARQFQPQLHSNQSVSIDGKTYSAGSWYGQSYTPPLDALQKLNFLPLDITEIQFKQQKITISRHPAHCAPAQCHLLVNIDTPHGLMFLAMLTPKALTND